MKTGMSMSTVIDTCKNKKNIKPIKCDCKQCVNHGRRSCRFGWEPVNGKCTRYGTNHYQVSKEERKAINERNKLIEEQRIKRETYNTTLALLSTSTGTNVTKELLLRCCDRYKNLGNGRFAVKCTDPENLMINVRSNKTLQSKSYRVIK